MEQFKQGCWVNIAINLKDFAKHCYNTKSSSFNYRSLDCIILKGHMLVRKIYTMRNSLRDTDGYEDPESYQVDEIPKSIAYTASIPQGAQVITVERVLENCKENGTEKAEVESQQNTTFQSENRTNYKYAFGTRVKADEEFDKGLGIIGMGKSGQSFKRATPNKETTAMGRPKMIKKKSPYTEPMGAPKVAKPAIGVRNGKKAATGPKTASKGSAKKDPYKPPMSTKKKVATAMDKHIRDQREKMEKELRKVSSEEQKLEILRKKRQELYQDPFKKVKEQSKEEVKNSGKKPKKKDSLEELEGKSYFSITRFTYILNMTLHQFKFMFLN